MGFGPWGVLNHPHGPRGWFGHPQGPKPFSFFFFFFLPLGGSATPDRPSWWLSHLIGQNGSGRPPPWWPREPPWPLLSHFFSFSFSFFNFFQLFFKDFYYFYFYVVSHVNLSG
jgi:hypothetical protein